MSVWSRFDTPWDSAPDSWTWEKQIFAYNVELMWVIESDVDSDHDMVDEVTFSMRQHFDFKGNYKTHIESEFRAASALDTLTNAKYNLDERFVSRLELGERSSTIAEYSVVLGSVSGVVASSNMVMLEQYGFLFYAGLEVVPNSRYYASPDIGMTTGLESAGAGLFKYETDFLLGTQFWDDINLVMRPEFTFGMETEFEFSVYSWGRGELPLEGNWSTTPEKSGNWTPEPPLSGGWKREDDI